MDEWPQAALGDLGQIVGGGTPSRDQPAYWNGSIPWLTPGELTGFAGTTVSDTADQITELGLASSGARVVPRNTVLVTSRATLGSCALAGRPMATNQGFKNLIPWAGSHPPFLYHLMQTLGRELTRRASGTTFLEVSGREFARITFKLPPLEEQRRIAEILDTIDENIQATERVIAKLAFLRDGAVRDQLSSLLDYPMTTMEGLGLDVTVGIVVRPTQYYAPTGVPVLRSANVREGGLEMTGLEYMSRSDHLAMAKTAVSPGDLLTVRTGYPGTTAVVPASVPEANCVDVVITRTGSAIDSEFLALWVNSDFGKGHVLARQGGLAQQHFNVGDMKALPVPMVDRTTQHRLVATRDALAARVSAEKSTWLKLRKTGAGLAADLLSGRVRTVTA